MTAILRVQNVERSVASRAAQRPALATTVAMLLLACALAYWLWFGLTQRSVFQDEGISLLAAQGIIDTGYPRLPSGFIYIRGYLPNYLVAGSIYLFGLNQFAIMLPSLALGLASLWLVYAFARDAIGRPWVGVLAVVLLLALQEQTLYATSPRMYMALQFFTVLAAYSAWRGYIGGSGVFKAVAVLAAIGAIFSHDQGATLAVGLPLAVLVGTWALRRRLMPLITLQSLSGLAVMVGAAAFAVLYRPPDVAPVITAYVFKAGGSILGLRLSPGDWLDSGLGMKELAGYGFGFLPLLGLMAIAAARRSLSGIHPTALYAVTIVTVTAVFTTLGTSEVYFRIWFSMLPFYALLAAMIGRHLVGAYWTGVGEWLAAKSLRVDPAVVTGISLLLLAALGAGALAIGARQADAAPAVVGPPCHDSDCHVMVKSHYDLIGREILKEDLIISSNPFVTNHYLGRVDGYLRDKVVLGRDGSATYFTSLTDEYFGIPLYDAGDLEELISSQRRVWVITDERVQWISSPETLEVLQTEYRQHLADRQVVTYVNR